jgi:hypothetical protein
MIPFNGIPQLSLTTPSIIPHQLAQIDDALEPQLISKKY